MHNLISYYTAWLYWDPPKEAFTIPFINHPVVWYGILFVLGFILSYFLVIRMFVRYFEQTTAPTPKSLPIKEASVFLTDRLCWFVVLGTIIGARLGYVLFYDLRMVATPLEILKTWNGGLASHGGVLGIILSLYFFRLSVKKWMPSLTLLTLIDFVALPSPLVSFFIRLGNFVNQEILGTPTTLPWAVIFEHPADGTVPIPRHPVQLYEAATYLGIFVFLYVLWKRYDALQYPGRLSGWLFTLVFSSRFILEFWKANQESVLDLYWIQMGQLLSLPLIALGLFLLLKSYTAVGLKHRIGRT